MSEAYGDFAHVYDAALGRRFAEALGPVLRDLFSRYPVDPGSFHLDLASGTSSGFSLFREMSLRTISLDASLPMLVLAGDRARSRVCGEMTSVPLASESFSLVTCLYDSVNHLLGPGEIAQMLEEVRRVLKPGGYLVFDANHPRAYREVWGKSDPFTVDGEGWRMKLQTRWDRKSGLGSAEISGTILTPGGKRVVISETRRQRSYEPKLLGKIVGDAGLRVEESFEIDPFDQFRGGKGAKVMYVTRKADPATY